MHESFPIDDAKELELPAARVTLSVVEGPHAGRRFTFTGHDTFLVGRDPGAHFRLNEDDPFFSRVHFVIEVNPPLCHLLDLKSRNGTYVNGRRARSAVLRNGDRIRGGQTVLEVTLDGLIGEGGAAVTRDLPEAVSLRTTTAVTVAPLETHTGEEAPESPSKPGFANLPGYRLVAELGRGGMGVVYRGEREADGQPVAVKTIAPTGTADSVTVGRFLREADILRGLNHPGIVRFLDSGEHDGVLFFVMEYVPGSDARRLLRDEGPLGLERVRGWAGQMLEAVAHAHERGFVHRDLKPANLLVMRNAETEVVRLADFGLARAYQESKLSGLTLAGAGGGTPCFMPPEQVLDFRNVKPAADQYSAAATIYNLLTGQHPHDWAGDRLAYLQALLVDDPVPIRSRRPDLPTALATAVDRALRCRPEDRHADVRAFHRALRRQ